jgi:hypothetical protein
MEAVMATVTAAEADLFRFSFLSILGAARERIADGPFSQSLPYSLPPAENKA